MVDVGGRPAGDGVPAGRSGDAIGGCPCSASSARRKGSTRCRRATWGRAFTRAAWCWCCTSGGPCLQRSKAGHGAIVASRDDLAVERPGQRYAGFGDDREGAIGVARLLSDHEAIEPSLLGGEADELAQAGGLVIDWRPTGGMPGIEVGEVGRKAH